MLSISYTLTHHLPMSVYLFVCMFVSVSQGLQEATHQTKEEERLEEQAEIEAAMREKEERSVSINNPSRGAQQLIATPLGVDPPMRRVKILLLGDSAVGKSSLIHRITDNSFKQSLVSTVGVDYKVRKLHINGENVQVSLPLSSLIPITTHNVLLYLLSCLVTAPHTSSHPLMCMLCMYAPRYNCGTLPVLKSSTKSLSLTTEG
jgi:hypothetical protein